MGEAHARRHYGATSIRGASSSVKYCAHDVGQQPPRDNARAVLEDHLLLDPDVEVKVVPTMPRRSPSQENKSPESTTGGSFAPHGSTSDWQRGSVGVQIGPATTPRSDRDKTAPTLGAVVVSNADPGSADTTWIGRSRRTRASPACTEVSQSGHSAGIVLLGGFEFWLSQPGRTRRRFFVVGCLE